MKIRYMILTAAVALACQGCSDWDDHYDNGGADGSVTSNMSLWEEISSREDMSQFAQLLKRVGYDQLLSSGQSYTVWAPTNDALDFDKYEAMSDSLLKAELLNNHIARGYHRAVGAINERVYLLNKKVMDFEGDGSYNIGGIPVETSNVVGKNGVMHVMNQLIDFRPNFYDYFSRSGADGYATTVLDSIFKSNQHREMDLDNSVKGPMKDGMITYLDTVYVDKNYLYDELNIQLATEDSSYTMILPTDHAWEVAKKKMSAYYTYPTQIAPFTYNFDKDGNAQYVVESQMKIAADSLTNANGENRMLGKLTFSNTTNPCLRDGGLPTSALDSIRSTRSNYFCNTLDYRGMAFNGSDASDLFVGANKRVLSNGVAWVTDSLRFKPWQYAAPLICLRATSGNYQAANANVARTQTVRLSSDDRNPLVEGSLHTSSYYKVSGTQNLRPTLYFYIPNVVKTKYAVYLTMVPENIDDETKTPADQTMQIKSFVHTMRGVAPGSNGRLPNPRNLTGKTGVKFAYGTQESARVMTKYMGQFTPNICYTGLPNGITAYPMFAVSATSQTAIPTTTRQITLGVANIILVPMDAVDYYMEKGVITDYTDEMPELFWHLNMVTY